MKSEPFAILKDKIGVLEQNDTMTQEMLVKALIEDPEVDWETIRDLERSHNDGKLKKHWKQKVICSLVTPRRFMQGGKNQTRSAKHNAIIEFVETQAASASADLDCTTVEELCISDVSRRWRTTTQGTLVLHRMIRTLVQRVRQPGLFSANKNNPGNTVHVQKSPIQSMPCLKS